MNTNKTFHKNSRRVMKISQISFLILISIFFITSVIAHDATSAICGEGLVLIIKNNTSEVSCVKLEVANALVERGWGTIAEEASPLPKAKDGSEGALTELQLDTPIYVPKDEGEIISIPGTDITIKVPASKTKGAFAMFEDIVQPGFGPPRHTHTDQIEIFYFLEGDFEVLVGDSMLQVSGGDIAVVPVNTVHAFRNIGDTPGYLTYLVSPGGGGFEGFLYELRENMQGEDMPSGEVLSELGEQYGIEFVGPPLHD